MSPARLFADDSTTIRRIRCVSGRRRFTERSIPTEFKWERVVYGQINVYDNIIVLVGIRSRRIN